MKHIANIEDEKIGRSDSEIKLQQKFSNNNVTRKTVDEINQLSQAEAVGVSSTSDFTVLMTQDKTRKPLVYKDTS